MVNAENVLFASMCRLVFDLGFYFSFVIRKENLTNPKHVVVKYKVQTSISNPRRHLYTHYMADWVKACDDQKIVICGADAIHAMRQFQNLPALTNLEA